MSWRFPFAVFQFHAQSPQGPQCSVQIRFRQACRCLVSPGDLDSDSILICPPALLGKGHETGSLIVGVVVSCRHAGTDQSVHGALHALPLQAHHPRDLGHSERTLSPRNGA